MRPFGDGICRGHDYCLSHAGVGVGKATASFSGLGQGARVSFAGSDPGILPGLEVMGPGEDYRGIIMIKHPDFFTQSSYEQLTEEDVEKLDWLNRALAADPRTTDALIMVEVHDGQVILRGDTAVPGVREAAEDVAWGIPGVHSVTNQIVAHGAAAVS